MLQRQGGQGRWAAARALHYTALAVCVEGADPHTAYTQLHLAWKQHTHTPCVMHAPDTAQP